MSNKLVQGTIITPSKKGYFKKELEFKVSSYKVSNDFMHPLSTKGCVHPIWYKHTLDALDRGRLLGILVTPRISGTAREWFISCLHNRKQHNVYSSSVHRTYGMPQGSVLGPVRHILTSSLSHTQDVSINTMICQFIFQPVSTVKQLRNLRMTFGSQFSMGTHYQHIVDKVGECLNQSACGPCKHAFHLIEIYSMNLILHAPTDFFVDKLY